MASIFLSYRRKDSGDVTRQIYEELARYYGEGFIFLDEKAIPIAENFRQKIKDSLNVCSVFIPVIAGDWMSRLLVSGASGGTWEDPRDWVFLEIEEALSIDGLNILPILVNGVAMPSHQDLPHKLKKLASYNYFRLESSSVRMGIRHLIRDQLDALVNGSSLSLLPDFCHQDDYEALRRDHYRHESRYCLEVNNGAFDVAENVYLTAVSEHLQLSSQVTSHIHSIGEQVYNRYRDIICTMIRQVVPDPDPRDPETIKSLEDLVGRRAVVYLQRLHRNFRIPRRNAIRLEQEAFSQWKDQFSP